jgi:hypothetical protein
VEFLSGAGTERAIVDRAANLERPSRAFAAFSLRWPVRAACQAAVGRIKLAVFHGEWDYAFTLRTPDD